MATPFLPAGATTGDSGGELSSGDDSGDMESFQTPEAEATRSLAELFEKAAAHVQGLVQVASREQLLYLYARYKQVKVGNCNIPKPNFFDFEGKQKWEAWKALSDSSPSQAMQEYIAAVRKLDPGWNPQTLSSTRNISAWIMTRFLVSRQQASVELFTKWLWRNPTARV
ncbi:acyl-CoA-binding domain-containing protein 6 isoform X6 [Mastomys coucha]|uniref:acyl-CoA-binding domain-containing protein 6 isoform X6 n=1 Tax=Mastomys coucha TaxID=35658 RepID=UPI0012614445|nr:acyl-CoA-binding domain-containing protein 6 isoform X6 [Mastomys coucha]